MSHLAAMPHHLLTVDEWDALGVDDGDRCELVEGVLVVTPRPDVRHQFAVHRLIELLNGRLPAGLLAVSDVEVAVDESFPATFRAPDVVVVSAQTLDRNPRRLDPADVSLAVEFVSPGSGRTDRVTKFAEYQQAGIEHYWIVDLAAEGAERFRAYHQGGQGYQPVPAYDGEAVSVAEPVAMSFTLETLTRRS